jgi:predicted RND superfamily exporter protein
MGKTDKIFRITIGLVVIALGFYFQSWWGAIGIIPLFTSFIGWCPVYAPFGLSTISKNNKS